LDRAIWRAGELGLRSAEPLLLALLDTPTHVNTTVRPGVRPYAIAWALGQLGSAASHDALTRLSSNKQVPRHVQRIASEALRHLQRESLDDYRNKMLAVLPANLQAALGQDDPQALLQALEAHVAADAQTASTSLQLLYLIDSAQTRPAFLQVLRQVRLAKPFFYTLRYLFKAAEFRRDAEVFGILAHRFEKVRANARDSYARGAQTVAYSSATREYLRRRVWRTLRRLGQLGDPAYVKMAVGVLLPFRDSDAHATRSNYRTSWDIYAPYRALNGVLYTNSPRYECKPRRRAWRLRPRQKLGQPAPSVREEAFPHLWSQAPGGLMHLLAESECTVVHAFSAKALRDCPEFVAELGDDDVAMLAARKYLVTAELALEFAQRRHAGARTLSTELLLALASSVHPPARDQASVWIEARRTELATNSVFLAQLVVAPHASARAFARRFLRGCTLSPEVGAAVVGRTIAELMALSTGGAGVAADIALDAAQTLLQALSMHLGAADPGLIRDLLAHPLEGVQELGAELLLKHDSRSGLLPPGMLLSVFQSEFLGVRSIGLRLLRELSDDALALNFQLFALLAASIHTDVRAGIRPLAERLARTYPDIGLHLVQAMVDALLRRKLADGVPAHLLAVLQNDLMLLTRQLDLETVWRLLQSGSAHAQELGGSLLTHVAAEDLSMDQLVRLASHQILAVRQASWTLFERSQERVCAELPDAAQVADAKWPDSRLWAFQFLRSLPAELFTLPVLISIIDSTREDTQSFGREMLQKAFREEDAPQLLLQLSEHPGRSVQLFATNYLERYASDDAPRIALLVPYFTSVLSQVNGGRTAKIRVYAFLERACQRSEAHAAAVVALLHQISASISIESRARAIEILCAIHQALPQLALPIAFPTLPQGVR
jgi:hypothetical protein